MSLFLHGHQILILSTIAFIIAVLLPFWYTSPNHQMKRNVFQICDMTTNICQWTLIPTSGSQSLQTGKCFYWLIVVRDLLDLVLPVVAASSAIGCVGTSLLTLLLGSWFLQRFSSDIQSKCLLILTIVFDVFSCLSLNDSFEKNVIVCYLFSFILLRCLVDTLNKQSLSNKQ